MGNKTVWILLGIGILVGFYFITNSSSTIPAYSSIENEKVINVTSSNNTTSIVYTFNEFTEEELLSTCSDLSFLDKIKCVKDFVIPIYKFRYTNNNLTDPPILFEELRKDGGDCLDWSLWNNRMFDKMGLVSGISIISTNPKKYIENGEIIISDTHAFNWVRTNDNSNQYCIYFGIINPVCGTYFGNAEKDLDFSYKIINITSNDDLLNLFYNKSDMKRI